MSDIWGLCVEWSVPVALGGIATFVGILFKKYKALNDGIGALLRNSIIIQCERSLERGELPTHNRDNLEKMYEAYHNLGLNGSVTSLIEQARELPPKKDHVPDYTKKIE